MKRKVAFSFMARLALAAAVVFAAGACPAATFAKASASRGGEKKYVAVEWKKVKGAKGYSVMRSVKKDIRFAQVVQRTTSGTRKIKDSSAMLCTKYYYWVVPIVRATATGTCRRTPTSAPMAGASPRSSTAFRRTAWPARGGRTSCRYG